MLLIYKPITLTPLQVVQKLKEVSSELETRRIAYAGRLDPMAHGLLLLLVEPETKDRSKYQNLDKKYEFEVLFGMSTDSYDLMGIPKIEISDKRLEIRDLELIIPKFLGSIEQIYPPYSSKTVNGKQLYKYAREGKLNTIQIPSKTIKIYNLILLGMSELNTKYLKRKVNLIGDVAGEFRQDEILKSWQQIFDKYPDRNYQVAKFKLHCSSGTYVRQIIHDMGKQLGTGALAYDIKRTQIGNYKLKETINLD